MRSPKVALGASGILLACVFAPLPAAGQPADGRLSVGGTIGGSVATGARGATLGVSVGYRVNARFGIEVDGSYVPKLEFGDFPNCPPPRVCIAVRGGTYSLEARALSVSASLVSELPLRAGWIRPYLAAGAGVAHTRRERRDNFLPLRYAVGSTGPLLSAGGGVEFPIGRRVAVGIEVTYQRMLDEHDDTIFVEPDLNLTRIGSSLSCRF